MNQYDLVLRDALGRLAAIVEVKNSTRLDRQLAKGFRRNLVAHMYIPEDSAFILLSQDRGFIWKSNGESESEPDEEFPMAEVVSSYAPSFRGRRLAGRELEMVVYGWLSDILNGRGEPTRAADAAVIGLGIASQASVDLGVPV